MDARLDDSSDVEPQLGDKETIDHESVADEHSSVPVAPAELSTDDHGAAVMIQRLGSHALEPSFPLARLLRSAGVADDAADSEALALGRRFQSPFSWSLSLKMTSLCGPFLLATLAAYSAGAYALASGPLQREWDLSSTQFNAGITLFVTGFAFAPMILAPVSEAYGRYWVLAGSGVVFLAGTLGCALTDSYGAMLVSRLITGSGASVFATLTGGVVSDVFSKEERNTPMSCFSLAIMVGTGLGPLVSGITVDRLGWRWIFYIQLMTIGASTLVLVASFHETRSNVVLARKCEAINKVLDGVGPTENSPAAPRWRFQPQDVEHKLDAGVIWRSFTFPATLLTSEPVVFCFSLWVAFAWAILYMQFSSIGIVFRDVHGFDSTQVGAVYTVTIVAAMIGTMLAVAQDTVMRRMWPHRMATAEGRLVAPCIQSILLPAGLFWFGWTSRPGIPWISPTLAVGSCTLGIFSIYLAVFNYIADTYGAYASSAQAAHSMCRNVLAGAFPLFIDIMLRRLTYSGASSLLGGIGLLLTAIPWLLSVYGQRIREKSPFARAVMEM